MIQTFNQLIQKTIFLQGEKSLAKRDVPTAYDGDIKHIHISQAIDNSMIHLKRLYLGKVRHYAPRLRNIMTDYVKVHGEGNPSYELTKWSQSYTCTIGTT